MTRRHPRLALAAVVRRIVIPLVLSLIVSSAAAQTTTVTISGVVTDAQGASLAGVSLRARHTGTGFARDAVSDRAGAYRIAGLPVGTYELVAERAGFRTFAATDVTINVAQDVRLDITMGLADRAESITVSAPVPRISTRSSSVGEIVDLSRIQGLPLNGRQFANLAATVPGVGLGFHSDISKATQYTPQISGGNGRNINYVVDGGDNNDDTVGGLLQLFPLEAIEEFTVLTHRFDATYGRSSGAVLNVVTRSGTNELHGSWFTLARDDSLNGRAFRERVNGLEAQPYSRQQFGGSVGGPVQRDSTHFFAAYERTRQNTRQIVDTRGIFPDGEGAFDVPFRENLFTSKITWTPGPRHHVSLRYAFAGNTQPSGVSAGTARSAWATSTNRFHSANLTHNWIAGDSILNEAIVQFSDFVNDIPANTPGPTFALPGQITGGTSPTAPQRTDQVKWQFRNDVSSTTGRGWGISHEWRAGAAWVHEPELRVFAGTLTQGRYVLLTPDLAGPVSDVLVIGNNPTANFPLDHVGLYVQDDWRVSDRVTLNLGVRWDYTRGLPIDQSGSANFQALQQAGREGRLAGTLLDEFGSVPRPDRDNVQPRLGVAMDVFGNGRDVLRGGWGVYTDFGYIASNVLTAAFDAGQAGIVFLASELTGLRKLDGSFFRVTDPLSEIAHLNLVAGGAPPAGEVASPLLEQPYTRQANLGWSHQIGASTVMSADYVRVDGGNLNLRLRPNVRVNGQFQLAGIDIQPRSTLFRTALSKGSSRYDGLILAVRRRLSTGVDATASYTLAKATSDVGTAYDEIVQSLMQDIRDPFGPVQQGPSARTDSRHLVAVSGIVRLPGHFSVAPVFYYRSALPVHTFTGVDRNGDGINNDKTDAAYRYTGLTPTGGATFTEDGACDTINCSRRAPFSQMNLRVSRTFALTGSVRIEAIGEVFNVFNTVNPVLALMQNLSQTSFMQPQHYAGDIGQTEQRVGQIGFRVTF